MNISIILSLLSFFFLFPHACSLLNSALPPGLPHVSVTADHQSGGSAGHFRAPRGSRITQRLQLDPPPAKLWFMGSTDVLSQAGREPPGQTTETLPAADCLVLTTERKQAKGGGAHQEPPHHQTHVVIFNCRAKQFYFLFLTKISLDVSTCSDLAGADVQKHTSAEADVHQSA